MQYTIGIVLLVLTTTGYAGLYKTTVHSRANCLNNESITWWNNHPFKWRVVSIHKHAPTNQMRLIDTGFQYSDRVAAIHWGEGVHGGFMVWGYQCAAESGVRDGGRPSVVGLQEQATNHCKRL